MIDFIGDHPLNTMNSLLIPAANYKSRRWESYLVPNNPPEALQIFNTSRLRHYMDTIGTLHIKLNLSTFQLFKVHKDTKRKKKPVDVM